MHIKFSPKLDEGRNMRLKCYKTRIESIPSPPPAVYGTQKILKGRESLNMFVNCKVNLYIVRI